MHPGKNPHAAGGSAARASSAASAAGLPLSKNTYDANGNALTRPGYSTMTWSSYNYPTSISTGYGPGWTTDETVGFSYGPNRQRWQQTYSGNNTTETTDYIGRSLEFVSSGGVLDYRHYINGGTGVVAVYSRKSSGVNTFSYLLSDHQSSVASITNSSGAQVIGESFTAFGSRREATTWSGAPSTTELTTMAGITREGYTFQTALGLWSGLNHMKGRVEDAWAGRMLSADPTIPDPRNTQSYNRYSYVNNNPVTYGDPSGFFQCPDGASCGYNTTFNSFTYDSITYTFVAAPGYSINMAAITTAASTPTDVVPSSAVNQNVPAEFAAISQAVVATGDLPDNQSDIRTVTLSTITGNAGITNPGSPATGSVSAPAETLDPATPLQPAPDSEVAPQLTSDQILQYNPPPGVPAGDSQPTVSPPSGGGCDPGAKGGCPDQD